MLKVLDGVLEDDRLCGAVFSLDPGDAWDDERTWIKANPMLDDPTPTLSEFRQLALEAKHTPSQELSFRQFYTNEWLQLSASRVVVAGRHTGLCRPSAAPGGFHRREHLDRIRLALKDDSASVAIITLKDGVLYMFDKSFLPKDSRRALREADPRISAVGEGRITRADRGRDCRSGSGPRLHRLAA